jgi:hypothetical protein
LAVQVVTRATRLQRVIREAVTPALGAWIVRHGEEAAKALERATQNLQQLPNRLWSAGMIMGSQAAGSPVVKAFCTNENDHHFLRKFIPEELSTGEPTLSDVEFEARARYLNQARGFDWPQKYLLAQSTRYSTLDFIYAGTGIQNKRWQNISYMMVQRLIHIQLDHD